MSDENRKQLSNKAEHVWLSCFRAALTGITAGPVGTWYLPDGGKRADTPLELAQVAAELADAAFKEARKRIQLGRPGAWPDPNRKGWKCPTCGIFNDEWGDLRRELCRGIVERDDAEGIRRAYPCAELRPSEATP